MRLVALLTLLALALFWTAWATSARADDDSSRSKQPEVAIIDSSRTNLTTSQSTHTAAAPHGSLCIQGISGQGLMGGGSIVNLHPLCSLLLWTEVQQALNQSECDKPCSGRLTRVQIDWARGWSDRIVRSDVNKLSQWLGYIPLIGDKIR